MVSKNIYENDVYKMNSNPIGFCAIFNFSSFDNNKYKSRDDSIESASSVRETFKRLQFDVRMFHDLNDQLFISKLKELINKKECESHDCFVLYINSHGLKDGFVTSNNNIIGFNEMMKFFSNENCKKFINKPKIIVFDCCREGMSLGC